MLAASKLSKTPLDPATVTSLIMDDYDRRELSKKKKHDDRDVAYHAGEERGSAQGGRKDKECHNCKKRGHFKADCWAKGGGKEGQGPKGKAKGDAKGDVKAQGTSANVAAAKSEEDEGVWAVVDENGRMSDWASNSGEDSDWSILSDSSSEDGTENAPVPNTIPDASTEDAERLRHIPFSHKAEHAAAAATPSVHDSMPGLQTVSSSEISSDTDSIPSLEAVTVSSDASDKECEDLPEAEDPREDDSIFFAFEDGYPQVVYKDTETTTFTSATLVGTAETRHAESDLYDSGASRHMTPFRHRLLNYTEIANRPITAADKRVFHAIGKGDLRVKVPNGQTTTTIILKDVLYVPDMGLTIISISRIAAAGYAALFRSNFCRIFDARQKRIGHVHVTSNGLYRVDHDVVAASAGTPTSKFMLLELHRRMGHIAPAAVRALVKEGRVEGVELVDEGEMETCESCEYAKMTRKAVRKERTEPRATAFGDEVHSDVWGPASTQTLHHKHYYASFTDDATRWSNVELLHGKKMTPSRPTRTMQRG